MKRIYYYPTILLLLFFSACDQPFEPIREDDLLRFSIAGYLDASEDEQRIRVVNLHQQNVREGTGFEGSVYLQDVSQDSVVPMVPEYRQYSQIRAAYNFTTDYPIEPNRTYRIIAEQDDGDQSSVQVRTPGDFADPEFEPGTFDMPPGFRIREVTNIAEVSIRYQLLYPESQTREMRKIVLTNQVRRSGNSYFVIVRNDIMLNDLRDVDDLGAVEITNCEFFVAGGGPDWIDFNNLSDDQITLPNGITNVENGTGYVASVLSKRVLYENNTCNDQRE
ncbi:MAG: hypothetical protein ACQERO_12130 [Bacteroidota bacterium]